MGCISIFIQFKTFLFDILFLFLSLVSEGSPLLLHSLAVSLSGRNLGSHLLPAPGALPAAWRGLTCALSSSFSARVSSLSFSDFWLVECRSRQDGARRPAGLWVLRPPCPPPSVPLLLRVLWALQVGLLGFPPRPTLRKLLRPLRNGCGSVSSSTCASVRSSEMLVLGGFVQFRAYFEGKGFDCLSMLP